MQGASSVEDVTTVEYGKYTFTGVHPDDYTIKVSSYLDAPAGTIDHFNVSSSDVTGKDFTLQSPYVIANPDDWADGSSLVRKEYNGTNIGGYDGQIIGLVHQGTQWDDYYKPAFWDLMGQKDFVNITIRMSVYLSTQIIAQGRAAGYTGDPCIGWILQNGGTVTATANNGSNGKPNGTYTYTPAYNWDTPYAAAQTVPADGQWHDIIFSGSCTLASDTPPANWPTDTTADNYLPYGKALWLEGYGDWAGLLNMNLYIRNFQVTVEQGHKYIALTFDDGPTDQTYKLLDTLKTVDPVNYPDGVKASFFLVGMRINASDPLMDAGLSGPSKNAKIAARKAVVKRMFDEGHDVGNHSYTHNYLGGGTLAAKGQAGYDGIDIGLAVGDIPILPGYSVQKYPLTSAQITQELVDTRDAIQNAVYGSTAGPPIGPAYASRFFRTPFTADESKAITLGTVAKTLGFPIIYGFGSNDYSYTLATGNNAATTNYNNTVALIKTIVSAAMDPQNGGNYVIAINHDPYYSCYILDALTGVTSPSNSSVKTDGVIKQLTDAGFKFVSLHQMEQLTDPIPPLVPLQDGQVYYHY